jgi:hypothetical protein
MPFKSSAAPLMILIPPAVVPKAEVLPNFTIPALMVVAPVKVFVPPIVSVPLPVFCKVPEPLTFPVEVIFPVPEMMAAVVRVMAPDNAAVPVLLVTVPLIVMISAVEFPFNSKVAPDEMVVEADVPNALLCPNCTVPALMVVKPL